MLQQEHQEQENTISSISLWTWISVVLCIVSSVLFGVGIVGEVGEEEDGVIIVLMICTFLLSSAMYIYHLWLLLNTRRIPTINGRVRRIPTKTISILHVFTACGAFLWIIIILLLLVSFEEQQIVLTICSVVSLLELLGIHLWAWLLRAEHVTPGDEEQTILYCLRCHCISLNLKKLICVVLPCVIISFIAVLVAVRDFEDKNQDCDSTPLRDYLFISSTVVLIYAGLNIVVIYSGIARQSIERYVLGMHVIFSLSCLILGIFGSIFLHESLCKTDHELFQATATIHSLLYVVSIGMLCNIVLCRPESYFRHPAYIYEQALGSISIEDDDGATILVVNEEENEEEDE